LFSGYLLKDAFVGIGSSFWGNSIYISSSHDNALDLEFIPQLIKTVPLFFSFSGIFIALCLNNLIDLLKNSSKSSNFNIEHPQNLNLIYWFFNHKWYFDFIYNYYIGYSVLKHSYESFYKLIDKGVIEILGPQGFTWIINNIAILLSRKQSGYIYHSGNLLVISLGLLCYLVLIL
jgi:NADH-ubiquinone oxidoreductase chain 5